nr:uncharacterized protein LOC111987372 [Quercus suber]
MSCMCWNVRGLGNHRTIRELANIVRAQDPSVLFLAETWADKARLDKLCDELNFEEKWVVTRVTRAGGLALLWKNSISIKVVDSSPNFIDAIVNVGQADSWRFTGIYGFPDSRRKVETWRLLRDFNEILRAHEKLGGSPRGEAEMEAFRDVVDELGFVDLGFSGRKFTWKGKRGNSMILERLDHAFATPSWLEFFPATRGVPSFESNVLLASSKILHCGEKLTVWSQSFGSIKRQLVEASKRLVLAEEAAARGASYDQVRILKLKINDLLDKESLMWIQRARSLYLQTRDSNTRYFHSRASQRYKRNQIHGLRNDQHTWCTAEHQIQGIATAFFQDLFTTSSPEEGHPIFESILPVVTLDMNRDLTRSFSRDEVEAALKSMEPLSAPGPDGIPPTFFQSYWSIVGDDVSSAVLNCLNNCSLPAEINHTFITHS